MNNDKQSGLTIPYQELSPEALRGVIEEFVTREGTDYGEAEISLETKIKQVMNQLHTGKAVIVFDQKTETCNMKENSGRCSKRYMRSSLMALNTCLKIQENHCKIIQTVQV